MQKKNVFIAGCNNRIGKELYHLIEKSSDLNVSYGFDSSTSDFDAIVYSSMAELLANANEIFKNTDVLVICSSEMVTSILSMSRAFHVPIVILVAGFSPFEESLISYSSTYVPVYRQNKELSAEESLKAIRHILHTDTPRIYDKKFV